MLKRILSVTVLLFATSLISGCVYVKVTRPLDRDMNKTQLGAKVGHSTARSVAYLVAWGDAGVAAAARDGELETVNHLDVETFIILGGLYAESTTIAYGD